MQWNPCLSVPLQARSQPVAIAQDAATSFYHSAGSARDCHQELRRLQRELVVIEQRVQRGQLQGLLTSKFWKTFSAVSTPGHGTGSKEESPVKSVRQAGDGRRPVLETCHAIPRCTETEASPLWLKAWHTCVYNFWIILALVP